jgi:nicotinamidase-related amidase
MLLSAASSALLIVDAQTRLLPAVRDGAAALSRVRLLLQAARELGVPALATEQYPRGLGPTADALADFLPAADRFEKISFSAVREPGFLDRLGDRPQAVVCGFEAHVCVLQTAVGLLDAGRTVAVVADAVGSRDPRNAERALDRLARAGAWVVTSEMVVFEWMERAGTPAFKRLSGLIR